MKPEVAPTMKEASIPQKSVLVATENI